MCWYVCDLCVGVFVTCSTSYCLCDTVVDPWNVCVCMCVCMYVFMYVCMCVCVSPYLRYFSVPTISSRHLINTYSIYRLILGMLTECVLCGVGTTDSRLDR